VIFGDDWLQHAQVGRLNRRWCHLFAGPDDDLAELHVLAARAGLARRWFQDKPWPHAHYDVTEGKRWQAIRAGAVPVTWREAGQMMLGAIRADPARRRAALAHRRVRDLVAAIEPGDETERVHRASCLAWLEATDDIWRRERPAVPPVHLVAYAALADPARGEVFLVDHRKAGLQVPPGGHVETGEDPAATAARELLEELGAAADFSPAGRRPMFLSMSQARGAGGHTDVSLWYVLAGQRGMAVTLDKREFAGGRWWPADDIRDADPALFDPALPRFLAKMRRDKVIASP
jgi:8-oxo-dGTP diphosphatase